MDVNGDLRGVDLIYKAFTPYIGGDQGVMVSVKYRTDQPFASSIQKITDKLAKKLQDLRDSDDFWNGNDNLQSEIGNFSRVIQFFELKEFDSDYMRTQLEDVEITPQKRTNSFSINILANERISVFVDFVQKIRNNDDYDYDDLEFYYSYHGKYGGSEYDSRLCFSYLFSDVIPGKVSGKDFVLTFDDTSMENIEYLLAACGSNGFQISPDVVFFVEGHDVEKQAAKDRFRRAIQEKDYNWDIPEIHFIENNPERLFDRSVGEIV